MISQTRPPVAFRWGKVVSSDTNNVFWIWCFLWDPLADVPHLHLLLGGGEAISHLTMKDSAFIISRASNWYPLLLLLSLSGWDYWLVQGRSEPTWVTLWCFIGKQWTWVTFICWVQGHKDVLLLSSVPRSLTKFAFLLPSFKFLLWFISCVPGFIVVVSVCVGGEQGKMSPDQKCHDYSPY